MFRIAALLTCLAGLSACATAYCPPPDGPVPDLSMVRSHVDSNWPDYIERIRRTGEWRAKVFAFAEVENLDCQPYFGAANCEFDVVTRSGDGESGRVRLFRQFEIGPDGRLMEVLVVVHERRK